MAATKLYTSLDSSSASFNQMMGRFGVVTVMNAKVYDANSVGTSSVMGKDYFKAHTAYEIRALLAGSTGAPTALCELDTLKIANITVEGPTKTVSGGQYSNPLIKYGKTARLEMQDALGNAAAIEALCGGLVEKSESTSTTKPIVGLHNGSDFASEKLIWGDSFFIDQETGKQVKVEIIIYQFLPDSLFNLTQDAEGDATVFDMNGDLLTTDILVGNTTDSAETASTTTHGVFYSIIDPSFTYTAE